MTPTPDPVTHVESVDPWRAGDGGTQPETDTSSVLGAAPAPSGASAGGGEQPQVDVLMGFLADFHAAGREPEPEPEKPKANPVATAASYLSRFDFVPPDPLDVAEDLPPAAPLPVWPPVPGSPAPQPVAPTPEVPAAVPPSALARLEPDEGQAERRGVSVFRRLGRH